jgi:hypothetical protein
MRRHTTNAYGGGKRYTYYCTARVGAPSCGTTVALPIADTLVERFLTRLAERPALAHDALEQWRARNVAAVDSLSANLRTAEAVLREATRQVDSLRRTIRALPVEHTDARVALSEDLQEALQNQKKAQANYDRVTERAANDPHLRRLADVDDWARVWQRRSEATYREKRQSLYRLGLRLVCFRTGSPYRFAVAVGWPDAGDEDQEPVMLIGVRDPAQLEQPLAAIPQEPGRRLHLRVEVDPETGAEEVRVLTDAEAEALLEPVLAEVAARAATALAEGVPADVDSQTTGNPAESRVPTG